MSRQVRWGLALLLGAAAIAAIMIALRPSPEEQPPARSIPLVETATYTLTDGAIELRGVGTVQPREEVSVGVEVTGKLTYVNPAFRAGQVVQKGALLVRIDPAEYANRVRSAQADVAAQDVALLQAREEATIAGEELRQFAARDSSRDVLSTVRAPSGYAARILPPEGLGRGASAKNATTGPAMVSTPSPLAMREPQLRSAEAAQERAEAQLADARLALQRTEVRAPFGGIVRSETAAIGALVQPGQAVGSIVATDGYEVQVSLTEAEARLLPSLFASRPSVIPAEVVLDYGGGSYRWPAVVDRVDPILNPETRTITVFLRVPDPMRPGTPYVPEGAVEPSTTAPGAAAPPLFLGSFVRAIMSGATDRTYAVVPLEALRPGNEIWLLRDGRLQIVPVDVLQRVDGQAYVAAPELGTASGVRGQVVISPLRAPVEGMELRPQGEAAGDE